MDKLTKSKDKKKQAVKATGSKTEITFAKELLEQKYVRNKRRFYNSI